MTPEAEIKREIRQHLDAFMPDVWYMVKDAGAYSVRGLPDLFVCVRGRMIACEIKAKGQKARKLQEYRLEQIAASGAIVLVVDNAKSLLDCVKKILYGEDVSGPDKRGVSRE